MSLYASDSVNAKALYQYKSRFVLLLMPRIHLFPPLILRTHIKSYKLILLVRSVRSSECSQTNPSTNLVSYISQYIQNLTISLHLPQLPPSKPPSSLTETVTIASSLFSFFCFCPPPSLSCSQCSNHNDAIKLYIRTCLLCSKSFSGSHRQALAVTHQHLLDHFPLVLISYYFPPCSLCSSPTGFLAFP